MNAKQEILGILDRQDEFYRLGQTAGFHTDRIRIRKILDTHTLEPIGDGTPLVQECADLIAEAERRAKENGRGDVAYRNRKTSFFAGKEPIDDRPFDPTLCGFFRESAVTTLVATKFQSNSGGGRT